MFGGLRVGKESERGEFLRRWGTGVDAGGASDSIGEVWGRIRGERPQAEVVAGGCDQVGGLFLRYWGFPEDACHGVGTCRFGDTGVLDAVLWSAGRRHFLRRDMGVQNLDLIKLVSVE